MLGLVWFFQNSDMERMGIISNTPISKLRLFRSKQVVQGHRAIGVGTVFSHRSILPFIFYEEKRKYPLFYTISNSLFVKALMKELQKDLPHENCS